MKAIKKLMVIFACALCFFALVACDASVDCYYTAEGNYIHYRYKVTLSHATIEEIESSATAEGREDGEKWTAYDYFKALAKECNWLMSYDEKNGATVFSFYARVQKPTASDDGESKVKKVVNEGFFFTTVTYTQPNPMTESALSYADGTASEKTLSYVLKNGKDSCPALEKAFPSATGKLDKLTMSFYWQNDSADAVNGDEVTLGGDRYLRFTTTASDREGTISYTYRTVNPVGWYVTIGVLGVLAVAIVLIVTARSKKKPRLTTESENGVRTPRKDETQVYYDLPPEDIFGLDDRAELEDIFGLNDEKSDDDKTEK